MFLFFLLVAWTAAHAEETTDWLFTGYVSSVSVPLLLGDEIEISFNVVFTDYATLFAPRTGKCLDVYCDLQPGTSYIVNVKVFQWKE